MKLILFVTTLLFAVRAAVIPTEVMYNPRQGSDYEYLELHNTDTVNQVDISGWNFTTGLSFIFPQGTFIPANGYILVTNKPNQFRRAYGATLPGGTQVFGPAVGVLDDSGERIILVDDNLNTVFDFAYDDELGWEIGADGYGASLELICDSVSNISDPNNWRASQLPRTQDPFGEYSGSPGARSQWYFCPTPAKPRIFSILFSEVMYHPVKEDTKEDIHEFIEFFNNENTPVVLDGWSVASGSKKLSGIQYVFPTGSTIPAKSYFILAKDFNAFDNIYVIPPSV